MERQFIRGMFETILDPAEWRLERRIRISDPDADGQASEADEDISPFGAEPYMPRPESRAAPRWLLPDGGQA